jgi:ribose transport system ATP-binding protein
VLGMAGLVGAGRSEAARAIFGADAPLSGEITLDGRRLNIRSPKDAIREGIFLAPEDRRQSGLIVDFTVRENITLPGLKRYATAGLVNWLIRRPRLLSKCAARSTSRRQVSMLLLPI